MVMKRKWMGRLGWKAALALLCALLLPALGGCAGKTADRTLLRVASLKGPTTMGLVRLIQDAEEGRSEGTYDFKIYGSADEIVPLLANGDVDAALIPCNLAAVLYNKTGGEIRIAAVNTLGVLSLVETGEGIHSIADLKGRTVYSTGKGTTPEYVLNELLRSNGLEPGRDLTVEYKSEAAELAVLLTRTGDAVAVLPEPFATVVKAKNPAVRTALDFNEEWRKIHPEDGGLVTGVLVVRNSYLRDHEDAFRTFMKEYEASTRYVNENASEAGTLIAKYGIVENPALASAAIPGSHITFVAGSGMKTMVEAYLKVLFEANPQSVGGTLPGDELYVR